MMAPSLIDGLAPERWPTLVIVGGRFAGLMFIDPLWGMTDMPGSLRAALVALFALAVLPGVHTLSVAADVGSLVAPLATEVMLGVAIGLTAAIFLSAFSLAGQIASAQMGLNVSATITGSPDDTMGGIGELERRFATTIYVALGGHIVLLTGVAHSLSVIPPGSVINIAEGGRTVMVLAGTIFTTAARIAAPVLATLLLAHLVVAVLARAVPQLQSFAVAFPITIGLGFIVLGAVLPFFASLVADTVRWMPHTISDLLNAFATPGH